MTVESWMAAWDALRTLGVGGMAFGIIFVLYKRWYVTAGEADERVAAEVAKTAAVLATEREKNAILERELERREGIYIATMAEIRAQLQEAHKVREKVQAELTEGTKVLYRFTDILADLRDQAKPR